MSASPETIRPDLTREPTLEERVANLELIVGCHQALLDQEQARTRALIRATHLAFRAALESFAVHIPYTAMSSDWGVPDR